jgi:uncharacterized protein with NRDE domain
MCLIAFAYQQHPKYRLIVAANRDEFYRRPTLPAAYWPDNPQVLGGRDVEKGGTWMGITKQGRFAALTNFRDPASMRSDARSRGELVSEYLCGTSDPVEYLTQVQKVSGNYNGFNLLVGDAEGLYYYSNRTEKYQKLGPGIYCVSNHLLDTPWPKVAKAKQYLQQSIKSPGNGLAEDILSWLTDGEAVPDEYLPDTGVGLTWERMLSPIFIAGEEYGTRASTVLLQGYDGQVAFREKTYPEGKEGFFHFIVASDA